MWRKLLRGLGCLSYLIALGILFALVSYASFNLFVRRGVTPVPELAGLPESEARALLADQGLRFESSESDDRFDERVPAGQTVTQKPRSGTLVKRGSAVTVIFSRGPQLIEVPPLVGEALQAARVTLEVSGLTVGRTLHVYSDAGTAGAIVAQQPPAGARLHRAGTVDLFIGRESSGETYLMPDLVNRQHEEVRSFFEARGFRLGRVGYETYAGIAPGTVLRQFPLAGHPLRRGEVISLGVAAPGSR